MLVAQRIEYRSLGSPRLKLLSQQQKRLALSNRASIAATRRVRSEGFIGSRPRNASLPPRSPENEAPPPDKPRTARSHRLTHECGKTLPHTALDHDSQLPGELSHN